MATSESNLGKYDGMDEAALDAHIRLRVEAEVSAYKKALADEKLADRIEKRVRARDAARNAFHKLIHGGDDEQA